MVIELLDECGPYFVNVVVNRVQGVDPGSHAAVCCPWNNMRAMDTLQIAKFSPGTCAFALK
jgi:hypothetical protein